MSYYDDSSLFVAPNGYKTSVLFAQKPMDANGQLAFTRSNDTATRVDENGLIQKVRTNLVLRSQDFSQTGTWVTSTTTRVDSQTDPNGGTTASKFTATGANSNVIQTRTVSSGIPYTWSFYAKSDSATDVNIRLDNNNGNFVQANMALTTSWQRFSITLNSNATTILCYLGGGLSFTTGEVAYMAFAQLETGDIATDYIETTTAAVSVGPVANTPRINYLGGGCGKLLLEPQRTNLALFSEQLNNAYWGKTGATITANNTTAPDGTMSADLITATATTSEHGCGVGATLLANTPYTISIFAKSNTYNFINIGAGSSSANGWFKTTFNLSNGTFVAKAGANGTNLSSSIQNLGNGYFRISVTGQISVAGNFITFDLASSASPTFGSFGINSFTATGSESLFIWGAMLEAGSYVSSYIPSLGAAVTRGADACSKTGISSLIGQTEGTLFVQGEAVTIDAQANSPIYLTISDGTQNNIAYIQQRSNGNIRADFFAGGVQQARITSTTTYPLGTSLKMALAYASGDFAFYINGVLIGTATGTSIPAMSQINVGAFVVTGYTAAAINQALLFPTRLDNATLASLTTL